MTSIDSHDMSPPLEFGSQEGLQNSLATRAAEAVAALQEVAAPAAPAAPTRHVASSGAGNGIIQMLQKLSCNASYFFKIQVMQFASPMASERYIIIYNDI